MSSNKSDKKKKSTAKPVKKLTGWQNIGGTLFNMDGFAKISEEEAIAAHPNMSKNRIINVWKRANGKK